jgi:hypothetical protein
MPSRRTIAEWTTLLELEPSLRNIFVEGENDQRLLQAVFRARRCTNVSVRLIQEVQIPERLIRRTAFNSGNRARLLAFASAVEAQISRPIDNVRCVVDLDCDAILPTTYQGKLVCFTDSANMLAHFAEYEPIRHVTAAVYGHELDEGDFETIVDAALFLFSFRVVKYSLFPEASQIDHYRSLTLDGGRLRFDRRDYIWRFAMANGLQNEMRSLFDRASDLRARLRLDARRYMNSHDFLSLLYGALKRLHFVGAGATQTELDHVYQATITMDRLLATPLIEALVLWAQA